MRKAYLCLILAFAAGVRGMEPLQEGLMPTSVMPQPTLSVDPAVASISAQSSTVSVQPAPAIDTTASGTTAIDTTAIDTTASGTTASGTTASGTDAASTGAVAQGVSPAAPIDQSPSTVPTQAPPVVTVDPIMQAPEPQPYVPSPDANTPPTTITPSADQSVPTMVSSPSAPSPDQGMPPSMTPPSQEMPPSIFLPGMAPPTMTLPIQDIPSSMTPPSQEIPSSMTPPSQDILSSTASPGQDMPPSMASPGIVSPGMAPPNQDAPSGMASPSQDMPPGMSPPVAPSSTPNPTDNTAGLSEEKQASMLDQITGQLDEETSVWSETQGRAILERYLSFRYDSPAAQHSLWPLYEPQLRQKVEDVCFGYMTRMNDEMISRGANPGSDTFATLKQRVEDIKNSIVTRKLNAAKNFFARISVFVEQMEHSLKKACGEDPECAVQLVGYSRSQLGTWFPPLSDPRLRDQILEKEHATRDMAHTITRSMDQERELMDMQLISDTLRSVANPENMTQTSQVIEQRTRAARENLSTLAYKLFVQREKVVKLREPLMGLRLTVYKGFVDSPADAVSALFIDLSMGQDPTQSVNQKLNDMTPSKPKPDQSHLKFEMSSSQGASSGNVEFAKKEKDGSDLTTPVPNTYDPNDPWNEIEAHAAQAYNHVSFPFEPSEMSGKYIDRRSEVSLNASLSKHHGIKGATLTKNTKEFSKVSGNNVNFANSSQVEPPSSTALRSLAQVITRLRNEKNRLLNLKRSNNLLGTA